MMGCSKNQTSETPAQATTTHEVVQNSTADACVVPTQGEATVEQWADANNAFGFKLLSKTTGNVVLSPYSAMRALGMVYDGACGDTASGMRKAMSLPEAVNLSQIGAEIEKNMIVKDVEELTVNIDNRIWCEQSYALRDAYVADVKSHYGSAPESVDFVHNAEQVRLKINDLIAAATNDKIQNLLMPGTIDAMTRLVLTNAVYFKGQWSDTFKPEATHKADFRQKSGSIEVDMMRQTESYAIYTDEKVTAFDMDFNGPFAMMVLMPNVEDNADVEAALTSLESQMTSAKLREIREGYHLESVSLSMPKFKQESTLPLTKWLADLGMGKAMSPDADFSRMTGSLDLTISSVLQKAYIAIDENGAEAAAATAVVMRLKSARRPATPIEITVDHPFLYVLIERTTGTALFMGRVLKP